MWCNDTQSSITFFQSASRFAAVKRFGQAPKSLYGSGISTRTGPQHWFDNVIDEGLFSENPHVVLIENNWIEDEKTALSNFWVLEEDKEVSHYVSTIQAYTDQEYRRVFEETHFKNITKHEEFGDASTDRDTFQMISDYRSPRGRRPLGRAFLTATEA